MPLVVPWFPFLRNLLLNHADPDQQDRHQILTRRNSLTETPDFLAREETISQQSKGVVLQNGLSAEVCRGRWGGRGDVHQTMQVRIRQLEPRRG